MCVTVYIYYSVLLNCFYKFDYVEFVSHVCIVVSVMVGCFLEGVYVEGVCEGV